MGRFDKFLPTSRQLAPPDRADLDQSRSAKEQRLAKYADLGASKGEPEVVRRKSGASGNFAIALDATGSMSGLIEDAKVSIGEILTRVVSEGGEGVRVRFYAYRDYDVPKDVLESSALSSNARELTGWLSRIEAFGGGANAGEAIEAPLENVYGHGEFDAVLLAGDEPPNPPREIKGRSKRQATDAFGWAKRLGKQGIPVHTFVVGDRADTTRDFRRIADLSGGRSGRLDGSGEMIDMAVMAMLSSLKGRASVESYMKRHQLSSNSREFGTLLLQGPKS